MSDFIATLQSSSLLILDGPMGTELSKRGLILPLPLWSADAVMNYPEIVEQIYLDYISAGCDIITTATFRTEGYTFKKAGLDVIKAKQTCQKAVEIARHAIESSGLKKKIFIAGSIAPLEDCYQPDLVPDIDTIYQYQAQRIEWLVENKVDFLLLETMNNWKELIITTELAIASGLPTVVSMLLRNSDSLYDGTPLSEVIPTLIKKGAVAIGANCVHHTIITSFLQKYSFKFTIPYVVYPNHDYIIEGNWIKDTDFTPEIFIKAATLWKNLGAKIIGGCCGTDPEFIKAISITLR